MFVSHHYNFFNSPFSIPVYFLFVLCVHSTVLSFLFFYFLSLIFLLCFFGISSGSILKNFNEHLKKKLF